MWADVLNKLKKGKALIEFGGDMMNVDIRYDDSTKKPILVIGLKDLKWKRRRYQTTEPKNPTVR